jgi:hypothetical protein
MKKYATLYERLVANTVEDDKGCWVWTGPRRGAYPCLCVRVPGGGREMKPKNISATRAMLEEVHDVWFPFDEAGHLCFNTLCVNPSHLEIQTAAHNMAERRGYSPPANGKPWIPVLYPRAADIEWEDRGETIDDEECPF